jgi:hypothetical protein
VGVLGVIGIGGLATGPLLIADPTGAVIGAGTAWLERTPLDDWAPVGWFLILVMGVIPLVIAWGLITRHRWGLADRINPVHTQHWSWTAVLVMGGGTLLWLALQFVLIDLHGGPQPLFAVFAVAMLSLPWLPSVRRDLPPGGTAP